jgi:hypothetical protein
LTRLSHPHVTNLFASTTAPAPPAPTSDPGVAAGAHDTPVHPTACARSIFSTLHVPALASYEITDTVPSLDAHASFAPYSCGAHEMAFTLPSCVPTGVLYAHVNTFGSVSL